MAMYFECVFLSTAQVKRVREGGGATLPKIISGEMSLWAYGQGLLKAEGV